MACSDVSTLKVITIHSRTLISQPTNTRQRLAVFVTKSSHVSFKCCYIKQESFLLELAVRPTTNIIVGEKNVAILRRYIIQPLLNFIDADDPLELLTEMRNVVIVFGNFVVPYQSAKRFGEVLDLIYSTLCRFGCLELPTFLVCHEFSSLESPQTTKESSTRFCCSTKT
jgi:hypothetical protein